MALIDIADVADSSSFRRRLVPGVAGVANMVMQEDPTGKYNLDNKRNDLARAALRDPVEVAALFVWSVLSNPVIAAAGIAATDGDIQYQITQSWSTIAGVTTADQNQVLP